jgi:hypothetical protein
MLPLDAALPEALQQHAAWYALRFGTIEPNGRGAALVTARL